MWTLKRLADGSERPMTVPGDIISALLASEEIPDPYYDRNELDLQWVGREDWLLERDVLLPPELYARERIFLEIDVLDTIAEFESTTSFSVPSPTCSEPYRSMRNLS